MTISKCAICTGKSATEICQDCNTIYRNILGATFETEEEVKHFMETADVPNHTMRKLRQEMSVHIYGA